MVVLIVVVVVVVVMMKITLTNSRLQASMYTQKGLFLTDKNGIWDE